MSCSKELRIPKKWSKHHDDIVKEAVNKELFSEDEFMKYMAACGVSDKSRIQKYIESVSPYHFVRCLAVFIPDNPSYRDVVTTFMYFAVVFFYVDDYLETYSNSEVHQLCEAFAKLDKRIWERYPQLPTIPEMKQYLKEIVKVDEKLMPHIILIVECINRITNALLRHGQLTQDGVRYFRRKLINASAMSFEGVEAKSAPSITANNTYSEYLWRRLLDGAAMLAIPVIEVTAESIGKVEKHVTCITELCMLSSLFSVLLNDLYSYNRETNVEKIDSANIARRMIANKDALHVLDAAEKITPIMNAFIKEMYQKSEKVKCEYPNNPQLHKLLDYIGMATAGWYFIHEKCLPRYTLSTTCRISLVEVEEEELEQWKKDHDQMSFSDEMGLSVKNFLYHSNTRATRIIDAFCGRISPRGHVIPV